MIYRKRKYKYELESLQCFWHGVTPSTDLLRSQHPYYSVTPTHLCVMPGYAWDGPSGPTIDRDTTLTPSLYHDTMYQIMRVGELDKKWKDAVDRQFVELCKDRGMWHITAKIYLAALKTFGTWKPNPERYAP